MLLDSTQDSFSTKSQALAPFRIVAIYDSTEASAEAARATAVVMRELGEDVEVARSSWAAEALKSTNIAALAAIEAARADMVVIALCQTAALPDSMRSWVKQWEGKRVGGGLLALIPGAGSSSADLEDFFYETSVTAGMDYLSRQRKRF